MAEVKELRYTDKLRDVEVTPMGSVVKLRWPDGFIALLTPAELLVQGFVEEVAVASEPPALEIYECTSCGALVLDKSVHTELYITKDGPAHDAYNVIEFTRQERVVEIKLVRKDQ